MNNFFLYAFGLVMLIALVISIATPGPADSIPPRIAALVLLTLAVLGAVSWLLRRPRPAPVSRICAHCGRSRCVTDLSPLCRTCADALDRFHLDCRDRQEGNSHGH